MGRPYRTELEQLPVSIEWARTQNVAPLAQILRTLGGCELLTVGSGGSFVAAAYSALLHESLFGRMARASTPLEASTWPIPLDTAALLFSARGNNTDILGAFAGLSEKGPTNLAVVTALARTPLARQAVNSGYQAYEFSLPTGRDGFLATNSLMATLILVARAYHQAAGVETMSLEAINSYGGPETWIPSWSLASEVSERTTLIVLSEGWARIAAIDLETRFAEAGLGNVSLTDYRNFAHGRHYWLERHGASSAIVSLETPASRGAADRTIRLLPPNTLIQRIQASADGPVGAIELVGSTMALTLAAAELKGIDPGRPAVPEYGRRLYHVRAPRQKSDPKQRWLAAKARALGLSPAVSRRLLEDALSSYLKRLLDAQIHAIVLDYDGTLCSPEGRYASLERDISRELNRLLSGGIKLGVATGRGSSAHTELRKVIEPSHWSSVVVGIYNGDFVFRLDEEMPTIPRPVREVVRAAEALSPICALIDAEMEIRHRQISIRPRSEGSLKALQRVVAERLNLVAPDLRTALSSHSVDVLMPQVSKSAIVKALRPPVHERRPVDDVLAIGDRGSFLGNDFELLAGCLSLSVDDVSSDLDSCWNLSPTGVHGYRAAREYLRAVIQGPNGFHLSVPRLLKSRTSE